MKPINIQLLFSLLVLLAITACNNQVGTKQAAKNKAATAERADESSMTKETATEDWSEAPHYDVDDMDGGEILMDAVEVAPASSRTESADLSYLRHETPSGPAGAAGPAGPAGATGPTAVTVKGERTAPKSFEKRSKKGKVRSSAGYSDSPAVLELEEEAMVKDRESVELPDNLDQKAGTLTAGEVNDFSKWKLWQDITADKLVQYKNTWEMAPEERYTIQLTTDSGHPVVDAKVLLKSGGDVVWESRSDNTGKAELWNNLFDQGNTGKLTIEAQYEGETKTVKKVKAFHKGMNHLSFEADCSYPLAIDIAFVVDATGSMGDEIRYLQAELFDIIKRTQEEQKEMDLRLGTVFYRDHGEQYVTRHSEMSSDISQTVGFIREQVASGGGDYPEAVEDALKVAIETLEWQDEATARLLFLVLDAPPHKKPESIKEMQRLSQLAAQKGIHIVPVTGSGINKSVEYLMRSLALATNGTYTFLTDDSGVGGKHIKPTTDKYEVEKLNDLLVRLIQQYTEIPDCDNPGQYITNKGNEPNDGPIITGIKCYPNPSDGFVNVDLESDVEELFVTDGNGKILLRYEDLQKGTHQIDLRQYPTGMYFFRFSEQDKAGAERVMIVH